MKPSAITLLSAAAVAALYPSSASAQRQFMTRDAVPYFNVAMGAAVTQDGDLTDFGGSHSGAKVSYHVGMSMQGAAGFAFNKYLAAELEGSWTVSRPDSVRGFFLDDTYVSTFPIMAKVIIQLPIPRTLVAPYIGAGVGGTTTIFDTDFFSDGFVAVEGDDADFVFAWQAMAGLRVNLNEQMSIGVGYRFLWTEDCSRRSASARSGSPPSPTTQCNSCGAGVCGAAI
jgi:opacity protein-like surface antigen